MGREKYQIKSSEDFYSAIKYIERNLKNYAIRIDFNKLTTAGELQDFCSLHLDDNEWRRLRVSIRAERKRNKDSVPGNELKNITLSPNAFNELSKLQRNLEIYTNRKISYSELIASACSQFNDMTHSSVLDFLEVGDKKIS
ncbi:MAG: hypothetical protein KZQ64_06700 [gamma proteobacterium symbiont of Bathyaustriella thionipta]|nr:hypothetical protein [gamma proteobacterium symbiont of Bathyaustriella thionipta]MCU7953062.1 hypothetical protein [gamma proteobacterium symbiont of Bathyaustriella thionipta]MCU7957573.1 hypothetical protein [gamma proteobacterium symbiont of Bathyaustriella thionipta]MCU7965845.1 hypothetical protein [gamma proteobacterium symbiont of Bathyaustriella thionipta]